MRGKRYSREGLLKRSSFIILACLLGVISISQNASAQLNNGYYASQNNTANPWDITSVTVAGGPILSKHFQSGDNNFNQHHMLGIIKVGTQGYGNWGAYFLNPNSVRKPSVGGGYITNPYTIPLGTMQLELTGGIGLVTGYQSYPVPLISGDARLAVYQSGPWNAGLEMAAMPYVAEDTVTHKNKFGIVGTTPFLSVRYTFN